jgi:type II secretory ATPase GspE/PulE/Tfp pilus assembly ATPase PilB-like protein
VRLGYLDGVTTQPTNPKDPAGSSTRRVKVAEKQESPLLSAEAPSSKTDVVDNLIAEAARMNASDIHIEPGRNEAVVRYRIDGMLQVRRRFPINQLGQVVSRVKVMAQLDVTERRHPLDGRVSFGRQNPNDPYIDLRISTVPLLSGEKVVIRLLYSENENSGLADMGFLPRNMEVYRSMVECPSGLILHGGPAGSGKTTSVYAAIRHLNDDVRNISTVEDPIECEISGVNQAQVKPDIGLTFAKILRAYLRQDCNVIFVGEIRDSETCEIAIQASLTGHLILGTIHSESAVGTITRLQELGISNYFIGSSLRGVIGQRLVRRLCDKCRVHAQPPSRLAEALGMAIGQPIWKAAGCRFCGQIGYRGRFAVHEVLDPDPVTRDLIFKGASPDEIEASGLNSGMIPLWLDALIKVRDGVTSLEEAARVVRGVSSTMKENAVDPFKDLMG